MQYLDSRGETYCARHKNKCNQACPYRMPLQRRTPIPLNRMLVGTGWPGFGYNYGMFGIDEEKTMGLSGPHHHGHRRGGSFRYNTYMPYPWWYSPMQYAYEEEEVWDASKAQWVRRPVRRTVPITDNPPEGEKYGVFGGSLSDYLGAVVSSGTQLVKRPGRSASGTATPTGVAGMYTLLKYSRGVGLWRVEGTYTTLPEAQAAVPAVRKRYGSTVSLVIVGPNGTTLYRATGPSVPLRTSRPSRGVGDDGDYGVLSKRCRPYGSLSRRYQGNTGVLGATPAPAPEMVSPLRTERAAKCMLVGIGIVAGLLLIK